VLRKTRGRGTINFRWLRHFVRDRSRQTLFRRSITRRPANFNIYFLETRTDIVNIKARNSWPKMDRGFKAATKGSGRTCRAEECDSRKPPAGCKRLFSHLSSSARRKRARKDASDKEGRTLLIASHIPIPPALVFPASCASNDNTGERT